MDKNTRCYIGIDGGGTNSRLLALDENGAKIAYVEGGSTNISSNPREFVVGTFESLMNEFSIKTGLNISDVDALCIGSAGVDVAENVDEMIGILREIGFACDLKVINDAELILWAEMKDDEGVTLISGTGSIAYGKNSKGQVARTGGWGYLIDDLGSGYWIGRKCMSHIMRAYDKREDESELSKHVCDYFGASNPENIIPIIYSEKFNKQSMARLSVVVEKASQNGVYKATAILLEAATKLFEMVETLLELLELEDVNCKVVYSGGVICNSEILRDRFELLLHDKFPKASMQIAKQKAVEGAAYLASTMHGE